MALISLLQLLIIVFFFIPLISLSIFDKGVVCVVLVIVLTENRWGRARRITEGNQLAVILASSCSAYPPCIVRLGIKYRTTSI